MSENNSIGPLAEKFAKFCGAMRISEMPREQALFAQGSFLAGAQASFQILSSASDKTREEALMVWAELQNEIRNAAPRPTQPLVVTPPEKQIIV